MGVKNRWSEEECGVLRRGYAVLPPGELISSLPGRSWSSIVQKGSKELGIKRTWKKNNKGKMGNLLQDSHLSFYWMGFLLGDGSFNHKKKDLVLSLCRKDRHHLQVFANFVERDVPLCGVVSCKNEKHFQELVEKYHIVPRKTYNPPSLLPAISRTGIVSFFIGLIDADGSFVKQSGRNDCTLKIKMHGSWLNYLRTLLNEVSNELGVGVIDPKLNAEGYAEFISSKRMFLRALKKHADEYGLPTMTRKWSKLELKPSRTELAEEHRRLIACLVNKGMSYKDMAVKMGISYSAVYAICNKLEKGGVR